MGQINLQRQYITKSVEKTIPARMRNKENSRRKNTYKYHFSMNDERVSVCRKFFLETLDISQDIVFGAFEKLDEYGAISLDQRGHHLSLDRKRIPQEAEEYIRKHICSFPNVPSHYCRSTTKRNYLYSELNITKNV